LFRRYWPAGAAAAIGRGLSWIGFGNVSREEAARVRSIRRLIVWLPLAYILVSGGILALLLLMLRMEAIGSGERLGESHTRLIEEQTTRTIQAVDQTLQLARARLTGPGATSPANDPAMHEALRALVASRPFIRTLSVLNAAGREIHTSDQRVAGVDASDRAYFKLHAEHPDVEFEIGAPLRGRAAVAKPFIPVSRPWRRANGDFAGVIVASIEPRYFADVWAVDETGDGNTVALFRRDGVMLMRSPYIETVLGKSFADDPLFAKLLPASPSDKYLNTSTVDGRVRLLTYRTFSTYPTLVIAAGQTLDHVLAAWHRYLAITISGWVAASGALGGLAAWLMREWKRRQEGERKLETAHLVNQRVFETSVDLILVADSQGNIIQVSPSASAILGYRPDEMIGHSAREFLHAPDLEATRNEMRAARRGGTMRSFQCRYEHKNGKVIALAWAGVWSESDRQYFFIGRDMTEGNKAQADLREAKEMFAAIIDASPEAILCLDPHRNVLIWNRAAERIFGYTAAETLNQPYKLVPRGGEDEYSDLVERAMRGERLRDIHVVRTRKDGVKRQVSFSCAPLYGADRKVRAVIYALQDVTERNTIEQQLRQSQKLEAVGQLTGGLAHDFNNLLGVIIGNLDLVIETADPKKQETQFLKSALEGSMRGADLVRRLMLFSRRQPLNPSVFSVNQAIEEFTPLLRRALGESIELQTQLDETASRISTDKHQLENALMNLCVNARDAMPSGGVIRVETANVAVDAASAPLYPDIAPGKYVMVAVTDNGTGITPEDLQKVFEPFFTTKSEGKGTGLGLSMVYGFMRESSGTAKIYSEPGHGTTVRLYFPQTEADITVETETDAAAALPTGDEMVLVVEDRVDVRAVAVAVLERLGYRVLEADTVAAALAVLNSGAKIDLVFSDIVMPGGLSGLDLAQDIRKRGLKMPILLTSGYASPQVLREQAQKLGLPLIGKPYRVADLAARVRAVLDGRNGNGNGKNGHTGHNGKA